MKSDAPLFHALLSVAMAAETPSGETPFFFGVVLPETIPSNSPYRPPTVDVPRPAALALSRQFENTLKAVRQRGSSGAIPRDSDPGYPPEVGKTPIETCLDDLRQARFAPEARPKGDFVAKRVAQPRWPFPLESEMFWRNGERWVCENGKEKRMLDAFPTHEAAVMVRRDWDGADEAARRMSLGISPITSRSPATVVRG